MADLRNDTIIMDDWGDTFSIPGHHWIIRNNIIELNRGDYFQIPIYINAGNKFDPKRYILRPDDKLYIGIAEPNQPFEFSLIKKVLTRKDFNNKKDVMLRLEPKDTEYVMPGKYYLEAKLALANGRVYTIIPKRQF